jgi:hypothetical protein
VPAEIRTGDYPDTNEECSLNAYSNAHPYIYTCLNPQCVAKVLPCAPCHIHSVSIRRVCVAHVCVQFFLCPQKQFWFSLLCVLHFRWQEPLSLASRPSSCCQEISSFRRGLRTGMKHSEKKDTFQYKFPTSNGII